jgi:hypothetical protein
MPKRSNSFQRLVKLLHERLDNNWKVTESKMFKDSDTGEDREVDVVLESTEAGYEIVISIECRDHKRKADVTWVESMAKRHESLPTSKLALWSASGFSKSAIKKAKKWNIATVSGEHIEFLPWAKIANQLKGGSVKLLNTEFAFFIDVKTPQGTNNRLEKEIDYLFKETKSEKYFKISELKDIVANDPRIASMLLDHATEGESDFWIQYTHPVECVVQDENQEWNEPFRIGFGIKAIVEQTNLETHSVLYENKVSTLAIGQLKNRTIELFIEEENITEPNVISKLVSA